MLLLLALACGRVEDAPSATPTDAADTGDTDTIGPSCAEEPLPPASKDTGAAPTAARTLTGTVTWTLTFDDTARAAGFEDCTYTRTYAQTEVTDQGYLCPDCELLTTGTAVMIDGYEDCFVQISSAAAERVEHFGLGMVDGERQAFRSGTENVSLGNVGATVGEDTFAVAWEDTSTLDAGGSLLLAAAGELTLGSSDTETVLDAEGARTEPYTCGWPLNNPGGPNADWALSTGAVFPNVRLQDQCGDAVDLWDFRGHYLVIDSSSPDCGPCQAMAEGAEDFKARMEAACVPVELVTLLNASLSAINMPAEPDVLQDWAETFGLSSPVLADQGAAYALFPDYLGIEEGMSYPAVILVDPDGAVLSGATGFGDWTEFETILLDDWASRAE